MNLRETHMHLLFELPNELAEPLFQYFNGEMLPHFIGRDAPFERNRAASELDIRHLHFIYLNEITPQWIKRDAFRRTSDNFLIYTRHWRFTQLHCVLAVVTPEAHQRINGLLPQLIRQAEWFHNLGQDELQQLSWFK